MYKVGETVTYFYVTSGAYKHTRMTGTVLKLTKKTVTLDLGQMGIKCVRMINVEKRGSNEKC